MGAEVQTLQAGSRKIGNLRVRREQEHQWTLLIYDHLVMSAAGANRSVDERAVWSTPPRRCKLYGRGVWADNKSNPMPRMQAVEVMAGDRANKLPVRINFGRRRGRDWPGALSGFISLSLNTRRRPKLMYCLWEARAHSGLNKPGDPNGAKGMLRSVAAHGAAYDLYPSNARLRRPGRLEKQRGAQHGLGDTDRAYRDLVL